RLHRRLWRQRHPQGRCRQRQHRRRRGCRPRRLQRPAHRLSAQRQWRWYAPLRRFAAGFAGWGRHAAQCRAVPVRRRPVRSDAEGSRFHLVTAWDATWKVIAVGDFNKDGTTDVIWDNGAGVEGGWLMGNGVRAGTLQLPFFPGWTVVATGDFNRDGNTDILWKNADGLVP